MSGALRDRFDQKKEHLIDNRKYDRTSQKDKREFFRAVSHSCGVLKSPFSPPACISMSLWQSDPFSWLTEDEALLEMGLMVMLILLVLLMRGLMVMLLVLEPAEREASVEVLGVLGEMEDLVHHLLNLQWPIMLTTILAMIISEEKLFFFA